jgi:cellulose synthase/poly-beta-1,6-N-acetylglucosamine synthase-like glycosyltransferase
MEFLFWLFAFLTVYSYGVYPIVLYVWSVIRHRSWKQADIIPTVSLIISVYNEEEVIATKLRNALELEYPVDKLEIIVSSDGSNDGTDAIVAAFHDPRVVLHRFERLGKSACLNKVVPTAKGDIVLFTDANAMFPPDTLRRIVRNFGDPLVGLVTGGTRYYSTDGQKEVTGLYARLERWTKIHESRIASCVGADGAIFAIRRELFEPLKGNDINDFIIPLVVIDKGLRAIQESQANCREAADDEKKAFRRQVRITNRTVWAIVRNLRFADPRRYGIFAFFLISHKILRFGVPVFFCAAGILNLFLAGAHAVYDITLAAGLLFLGVGLLSYAGLIQSKPGQICKLFLITFTAQMFGLLRMLAGIEDKIWTPQR